MKCFYHSIYKFYKPEVKHELKFLLLSDIHFSPKVTQTTLNAISTQAAKQKPDYILIAGDLIDCIDVIESKSSLKRLTSWLSRLGEIAPTIISLGNHDFYRKNPDYSGIFSSKRHWYAEEPTALINAIAELKNVYLLNNSVYEDKKAYIFGFTQTPDYYQFDRDENHTTSVFQPGSEDKSIMLYDLHQLNHELINNLPKHKAKIALIHSPVFLFDSEVTSYLYEFDFYVSGHMHSGVVPPVVNDFWRSDRGLLAPGKKLFPRHSRANITESYQKVITCGAISTIQNSAKPITFMNGIFPVNIATLEFTHRETLARKPDVKHQYINF